MGFQSCRCRTSLALCLVTLGLMAGSARAESFDWEVREAPAGPAVTWLRGVRDGFVGFADAIADLQTGVFADLALTGGQLLMGTSDLVGLVDDNPLTQHVLKATFSKSLSRTAYLLHVSGSEAILGSHGLEVEWYLQSEMSQLNPLLQGTDTGPRVPQDPLAFMGEAMLHDSVYTARVPGRILIGSLATDVGLRSIASLARIASLPEAADAFDARGRALMRWTID